MEGTIVLLIDRRQAVAIKDGATPDGRAFKEYREGDDAEDNVIVTLEMPVWERLKREHHTPGDIKTIAGQVRLGLGA
jgi:hypothetical protein